MKTDTTTHGSNVIWIDHHKFSPSSITVPLNTTVVWTNKDGSTYKIVSDNGRFQSGSLKKKETFSNKFLSVGTYKYHCDGHADIKGEVIVQ